ncbi:hypothetical protein IPG41_04910 [Candidatus Peregrinibacteria bacterium]|nr:MAG: hypothetical protein IPG41_04910 [Candidatus Peregrinibacteria bacterium]
MQKRSYLLSLEENKGILKQKLNNLIKKYQGQPVGNGYIDIILSFEQASHFIKDLTKLGIAVETISWWCHCLAGNEKKSTCPHGYGGPRAKYREGWFSELSQYSDIMEEKELNESVEKINEKAQLKLNTPEPFLKKLACLTPGLWLYVPEDWQRE